MTNSFDREVIYSIKRASTSVYRADRHASVNLVYDSKHRRARRIEKNNLIVRIRKCEAEVIKDSVRGIVLLKL